jgi:hypothetical protein
MVTEGVEKPEVNSYFSYSILMGRFTPYLVVSRILCSLFTGLAQNVNSLEMPKAVPGSF